MLVKSMLKYLCFMKDLCPSLPSCNLHLPLNHPSTYLPSSSHRLLPLLYNP